MRHIGGSTHAPALANKLLDLGLLDMIMFSVNAAYDYKQGSYGIGEVDERMNLYRRCEKEGVGISVMKPFGGGQLLDASASPFKKARPGWTGCGRPSASPPSRPRSSWWRAAWPST